MKQATDKRTKEEGVKLIIQIPCYNEEETLAITLSGLPKTLDGVDTIEWLVIDDGSTDRTVEVAREHGVDHIVSFPNNRGLARAFMAGLDACVKEGADIIVNMDADNQYAASDIPRLIAPILEGKAEFVVGTRPISEIQHFSRTKKIFQKLGSRVVRLASRTNVHDAPSGFRAIRRDAAMRLQVFDEYTYTLETVIQAGQKGMAITSVPIRTNETLRPSRLIKSLPEYVMKSSMTIIRIFMTYKPFKFFAVPGSISFCLGTLLFIRFLYFYFYGKGSGHVQSVILAALLLGSGFFLMVVGLLADLMSVNRKLLETLDWRMQEMEEYIMEERGKSRGPS
jgi:glycosyltransferase involved in cell wall biosynthesis